MVSASEQTNMNRYNTHHKPIPLYCRQSTQIQPEDNSEDSEFAPSSCREENSPPLMSRYSPVTAPSHSRYRQAAKMVSASEQPNLNCYNTHHKPIPL
jgi:hypothetical protein